MLNRVHNESEEILVGTKGAHGKGINTQEEDDGVVYEEDHWDREASVES